MSEKALARVGKGLATLEQVSGGREALREQLSLIPATPALDRLLSLLYDKDRSRDSLRSLCAAAGVPPFELLGFLREAALAVAVTEASQTLADQLPAVMKDITEKAQDQIIDCRCTVGVGGKMPPDPNCDTCKGRGVRRREGSFNHQHLVLETAKMLPKSGGINIKNENKTLVMNGGEVFDAFVNRTDTALAPRIQEAVVIEEVPDGE